MIKLKNSFHNLVKSAKKLINQLDFKELIKIHSKKMSLFLNVKDIKEKNFAYVLVAKYITRGILEFWIKPNGPCNKEFLNENFNFVFLFRHRLMFRFCSA